MPAAVAAPPPAPRPAASEASKPDLITPVTGTTGWKPVSLPPPKKLKNPFAQFEQQEQPQQAPVSAPKKGLTWSERQALRKQQEEAEQASSAQAFTQAPPPPPSAPRPAVARIPSPPPAASGPPPPPLPSGSRPAIVAAAAAGVGGVAAAGLVAAAHGDEEEEEDWPVEEENEDSVPVSFISDLLCYLFVLRRFDL